MSERVTREDLMRYLDGEVSPEERARIESRLEGSTELARELELFRAIKADFRELQFAPEALRDSVWDRVNRRLTRPVGWILVLAGTLVWLGYSAYLFTVSPVDLWEKLATGAIVIGVLLLFFSVIWERVREWETDPYRHIER